MIDRGIIKWQPFNSCFSGKEIIQDIQNEKMKLSYPILSEDQLKKLEEKIKDAYFLKVSIMIEYFYDGKIYKSNGKITAISLQEKKICLENRWIYFKQILNINY